MLQSQEKLSVKEEQVTAANTHGGNSAIQLIDNRTQSVIQQKLQKKNTDQKPATLIQRKPNPTGLPDNLKSGIENLSGYAMDDVKVHYNSSQPAQLNAHAYAQGTDIHVASGQEKHLPHEAWHVVQQKQGRVKPTLQMKGKVNINDDRGLENEADVMGAKAFYSKDLGKTSQFKTRQKTNLNLATHQLVREAKTPGLDPSTKRGEGHAANRIKDELLEHKGFRKLNRLCGQINQIAHLASVATKLNSAIDAINQEPNPQDYIGIGDKYDPIKAASILILDTALAKDPLPPKEGDECLLLGTLDYWATNGHPTAEIQPKIESLRKKMQKRARLSIVAHRGMGATNKSFGGLISDNDTPRTRRTENSRGAFEAALSFASTPMQPWGLDGIECDVFLSQNGVPIVSHDGNISEQMSAVRRADFNNHAATIGDTLSADLLALERKAIGDHLDTGETVDKTVFISLRQLLEMAAPVAAVYAQQYNKAFRFEIEMKGSDVPGHTIIDKTAKVVSQFKKNFPEAANLEIVMFNGTVAHVDPHHEKRMTKTKLGGLVIGLGAPNPDVANHNSKVDEYRMSLSDPKNVKRETGNYISTYVLGGEQHIKSGLVPITLEWGKGPQLQAFLAANANSDQSLDNLWVLFRNANRNAARRMGEGGFKYPMGVEMRRANYVNSKNAQKHLYTTDPTKTHVLTDYPEDVQATRTALGQKPEGVKIEEAIQHLLDTHNWALNRRKGNYNRQQWEQYKNQVKAHDTFQDHNILPNATRDQIIQDLS